MKISRRSRDGVVVLDLTGAIIADDRFDLDAAVREIIGESPAGVILNLEEVPKMCTACLAVIVTCHISLAKRNMKLVLLNARGSVRDLLVITKLDRVLEKYDDEDEAVEAFKEASLPR
jgi:anti-anti-sigma factor